jgi:hypothetical protein
MLGKVKGNIKTGLICLVGLVLFGFLVAWLRIELTPKKFERNLEKLSKLPKVMLWAWERPENLKFIDTSNIGVAFLAKTISLTSSDVNVRPRLQILETPPNTTLIAVVRIETAIYQKPTFSLEQKRKVLREILDLTKLKRIIGIQIDFDAKFSERDFYKELLGQLRENLPNNFILSITALASWAIYDNWVDNLPVDEVVPMLFRMGVDKQQILNYLKAKKDFIPNIARNSLGISTDSELPWLPSQRRVYIFAEKSWSTELLNDSLEKVKLWEIN